ncbi:SusC/RagA family TonB-linked outer membrane protein [Hymenobacter cellulosilyticus]|uniref:SusC/RagA family TonB-linked outer membrane protein n=1 Tax=Hymenobacter cellulosilyticus TaxID=2932248 RepID=A0A8T9Q7P4_9BACT|nr:SusC/RagA family TonB-linked outer membrane protein [Hymenobacter cellulosilyticus]UOQ72078.1 SusC/RagA family TonB-linked outer membrane protein [Hymenobacter cellulosilyticus]
MKKLLFMVILLMTSLLQQAIAQDRTISGRVTDQANGQGLPGVTVLVKGTTIGASTNADGTYSLSVPASATTLSFTSIGYTATERPIGASSTIDIGLATDTKQIGEVVVTALGVERTRNSLPYSATQVEGNDITKARNPNFINSLSGKVAGVNIKQNNTLGGSTNVVIRGQKSLYGNNQALFVVDGVPIANTNTNNSDQTSGRGGYDYGNTGADVNPDDIASVTVLKGAAATALYGSRASNGVILITTKKGKRGLGVTINTGAQMGFVDKSTFVKYQKEYGAGYGAYYGPNEDEYFNQRDMNGDGVPDLVVPFTEDASYGAKFDRNLLVHQWNSLDPTSPTYRQATPWIAAENGPEYLLKNSVSLNNNITIDGGNETATFKLGYTNTNDKGILPNSEIKKNMANFAASFKLTPKLTTSAAINFTKTQGLGRYGTGYDSWNPMQQFRQWFQTNVDIKEQKEAYFRNKQNITWNPRSATDIRPIYSDNLYWIRYENAENDERYRYFGNIVATYKIADWVDVMGRVTLDSYDEKQEERNAIGSTGVPFYSRYDRTSRESNYDLIVNFNKNITEDFSFRGLVGANYRRQQDGSNYSLTSGGLVVPRLYALSNSVNPLSPPIETDRRWGVDGYFASGTFGYKELAFLDVTGRRDKSSTLPEGKNVYYYPSVAGSFVFSELLKDVSWLSYGKARLNYAEVGSDAAPYSTFNSYNKQGTEINVPVGGYGSVPLFSLPNTQNNAELVPERTRSTEGGVEMAFLNSRLGFDVTLYRSSTINQIIPILVPTTTGFNNKFVNSGEVENKGIELTAFVTPVKNDNFSWTVNANWTRNRNKILSLKEGTDNLVIATYQGGVSSNATIGQPFGTIRGAGFTYLNGEKLVGENGLYVPSPATTVIANPNADWTGGISNTVAYKGISLYFLLDVKKGGQLFNLDTYYGFGTGLYPETVGLNDLGNPSRLPIAEGGGIIFEGVKADGSKNDIRVENGEGVYGYNQPQEMHVYDAGFVKLREASLTYSLPAPLVAKVGGIKGVDISLTGRNLWIIKKNVPYADPEDNLSSGNLGQGYMSGSYPTTRNIGFNLRFSF